MNLFNNILGELDAEDEFSHCSKNMKLLIRKFYKKYSAVDLFVWDFDQTLTKFSTIRSTFTLSTKRNTILGKMADAELFYHLVNYLLAKGKGVAIASWNDPKFYRNKFGGVNLIKFFMDKIFKDENYFTKNNIISYFPKNPRNGKNTHLQLLSQRFNIPNNKILLFDDSQSNIQKAQSNGYNISYVPPDVNFTFQYLEYITS